MKSDLNDFWGGLFDLDEDGEMSFEEELLAYKFVSDLLDKNKTEDSCDLSSGPVRTSSGSWQNVGGSAMPTPPSKVPEPKNKEPKSANTPAKQPDKAAYRQSVRNLRKGIAFDVFVILFAIAICIVFISAAFSVTDGSSESALVCLLVTGAAIYGIVYSIRAMEPDITAKRNQLDELLKTKPAASQNSNPAENRLLLSALIGIPALVLIIALVIGFTNGDSAAYKEASEFYSQAEQMVDQARYDDALKLFQKITVEDYKNTDSYIRLCKAHQAFDQGDLTSAKRHLEFVEFNYLGKKRLDDFNEFKKTVEKEYNIYAKKVQEENALEKEQQLIEKAKNGVPYIGMSESLIDQTSLGKHKGDIRHNNEVIGGKIYQANLYDFKDGKATIFTARCVQGKVTNVWDYRDDPQMPYTPSKSTKSKNDDPYDVKDYAHVDDFYYDHYDDFFDLEDAEEYYEEHTR